MGQNSSTSAFQNSSQPFFQRHRSSALDLRPNGDEGSKSFSHAAQMNPSRGVQEVVNAGKQVNSVSQEPHSDYANRSQSGRVSELLSEKVAFTAASVKEASSNKENLLPTPFSLISSADTSFSNGRKSEDGKRQEYFQNAIKADHISRSVSEHSLLATAEDHPARESNLFRSQSMERTFSQPKKSTKHKRQTSAVSRMSLQNNVILEDSREHLYNPARDEPFSSYQPTSASLPLKSSFDIDYALNLTYAQLAEYRRNIRTNDLMARKGQKWEELGAEISASNTLPKSPFELQNLGGKSGTSSVSTNSSDTGVSRSKKKRAPAPPVPSTRPQSFAGNPSRDSVTSGHSFGFLHNTGKSVQRTVSSVSRSSKPPAPQPLPTSYSFMSLDKSVPGVRNPRALGKSSRPTSAILPRWDQEKVSVATSAELFSSLYNKESLNESIDQAKKQLEAMKKLQEKLKYEKFTEKSTSEKDTKDLTTDTVAKDDKIDTESGHKDNDKSVDKDNVVGTVKKDALTDTAIKKEADQIQSTVNSLSTNAADISFLSGMDERQPPARLASSAMDVPTALENMDKTDLTQRNLVSEECKSSFQVFPEVDTSVASLKKGKANKDMDIVQDGHERERDFAKVITTHGTESVDVHLFSTYPENTNTEARTYPDNTSTEASTYPENTNSEASTYPENTKTEASAYPENTKTEASTYPENTNTEASAYPENTNTEASTYPENTKTEASTYPENTKIEASIYPENTKTEASIYPENNNTEASIYPENTSSAYPLNTNIEAAESSARSWKPDDKSQTPENDHQMEDRASTVSRDFSKRSSIQSEDMSISSSNTSQRVFSPDWAPEHDLDSDDDIMDEKYSERFSSQGFKSSTIPRKLRGFGEKKKEKKKKKSQRPHESKEEEKKKFGSIRRFKNSVHESMRTAIGSISKASGKLLKKQQHGRVLDATESSFPDSDSPKVSEYSRWGLSASCNGSIGHTESDDYTDYPFRNGEYDPGLSASSDDNIGDIDFAYGIDEIPVVRRESRHTIQDSQDKRNVKLPGVAYVAQKGQIVILPEYQTVQQDGHARLGKKGGQNDGHAPKIRGQKNKKYAYESTVRENEKHRMNELLAKEIFEKERQIDAERQRQREMEMEIQRLREAEADEQRNRTQRRNMQEQINLLQQSQLQQEQISLLQQSQLRPEHRELNSKALSTNHLNLVSVTPALQTSSVGYDTDRPWSNLSINDIGASPPSSLYFNNSVYMGQPVLLGPYQSMPVLPTVIQGQHIMNIHSSASLVNGAPITHCLSSIDIAYLSEYMRMTGVSPPTNSLEWNVLLSSCSVTPPSIPGSDRAHGQATVSGVRYGPDLSQIFDSKTMQEKDTEENTVFTNQQLTVPTDASPLQDDKGAVIYVPSKLEDPQTDIYSQTVNQPQSLPHITPDANTPLSGTTEPPPTAAPFTISKPTEDTHNTDILTAHSPMYKEQFSRPNQDGPRYNDVGAENVQIVTSNEFITTQTPSHRPRVLPASVYGPIGFRPVSFRGSHS